MNHKEISLAGVTIRPIEERDDKNIAVIIRSTLEEFSANHPGTVYFDESTDRLFSVFKAAGSAYWVAEKNNELLGGAGIFPTEGLPEGTCELVKMYLKPEARGVGLGAKMIGLCLTKAAAFGYTQVYLETMPELNKAVAVYQQIGFEKINGPMGNSGHFGCAIQMLKQL